MPNDANRLVVEVNHRWVHLSRTIQPVEDSSENIMREGEVIISYLFYHCERPVLQGGFDTKHRTFPFEMTPGRDGHTLTFDIKTDGTSCQMRAHWGLPNGICGTLVIEIPVNRTKVKWREFAIDNEHRLFVRAALQQDRAVQKRRTARSTITRVAGAIYQKR